MIHCPSSSCIEGVFFFNKLNHNPLTLSFDQNMIIFHLNHHIDLDYCLRFGNYWIRVTFLSHSSFCYFTLFALEYILYNTIHDYKTFKAFGCACYPYLRPYNPDKFVYHLREYVFLGYLSNHKEYTCLISNGKIDISKDVIFVELMFLYTSVFTCPSTQTCSTKTNLIPDPSHYLIQRHTHSCIPYKWNKSCPFVHKPTTTSRLCFYLKPNL